MCVGITRWRTLKQQVAQYTTALEMADGIDIPYVSSTFRMYTVCIIDIAYVSLTFRMYH